METVPYISGPKRGFPATVHVAETIDAVLYKFKTDVQWRRLPVRSPFSDSTLTWQGVYCLFNKWVGPDTYRNCWAKFPKSHAAKLDLSSADLGGSDTQAIRCGQQAEYQGSKKMKTTNPFNLTDRQGLPFAMSEPVSRNRNDLYDIQVRFEAVTLEKADIPTEDLFLNADAGFDSEEFRNPCLKKGINANVCFDKRNESGARDGYFDQNLHDKRFAVERTNAWMASYR